MHGCHSSMLEPLYRYRKSRVRIPLLHELGRSLSLEFFYPQISLKLVWAYFCSGNCLVWVMNKFNLRMRRRFLKHFTLKISAFQEFWAPYSGDWNSPNLPPRIRLCVYQHYHFTSLPRLLMRRGAATLARRWFACSATWDSRRPGRYAGAEILRRGSSCLTGCMRITSIRYMKP